MTWLQYYKKSIKKYPGLCLAIFFVCFQPAFSQSSPLKIVPSSKCAPAIVTFYNEAAISPGSTYLWDFGLGAVVESSDVKREVVYTIPGEYHVSLSIITGTDTTTYPGSFNLARGPVASILFDHTRGCVPFLVNFTDNSTLGDAAIVSYFWDFRNGQSSTQNPSSYTYNIAGNYDIFYHITDNNGCSDDYEAKQIIKVNEKPEADFSASQRFSCEPPLYVDFTNASQGTGALTNSWIFGNGQTSDALDASVIYDSEGSFDVSLTVTDQNGCSDSISREGFIHIGKPSGEIYARINNTDYTQNNSTLCPGTIRFASTLPNQPDYTWVVNYNGTIQTITGHSNINLVLQDSGRVDLKLKYGESGLCPDSIVKTFFIDFIEADFTMNKEYTCELPFTVQLQNRSENGTSFEWNLPNSTQNTNVNTSYTIPFPTTYRQIYTHDLIDYTYAFGLTATNENGCRDTQIKEFTASPIVARFMPDTVSGCVPLPVTFSDSSRSNENIAEWKYLIDSDELILTEKLPAPYTFNTVGEHEVYLVITNDSGCTDTSYVVRIRSGNSITPDFNVSPTDLCFGDSLILTFNGTIPNEDVRLVYSSPGLFSTGEINTANASVYLRPEETGKFPVQLEIDNYGCKSISILPDAFEIGGPVGWFNEEFECNNPLSYTFISAIQGADNLEWSIESTTAANEDTINYVFTGAGDYLVRLSANNTSTGCQLVKSKIIKVREVVAEIDVKPVACRYENVVFSSINSVDYIDSCYNEGFLWHWFDETPERRTYRTSYNHAFEDTGTYHPVLEVLGDNGCLATDTAEIRIVSPFPEISVTPSSGCGPQLDVQLEYTNHDLEIESWGWIFGDNTEENPSNQLLVTHTYQNQNDIAYSPGLEVTDIYGCSNSVNSQIALSKPSADFQASRHGICVGESVLFTLINNTIDSFRIDFGDGAQSTSQTTHQYNQAGAFDVSLEVWNNGCSSQAVKNDYIVVESASANFTVSDEMITCYPVVVEFTHSNPSPDITGGFWDFGDGINSGAYSVTAQHTYLEPGTYTSTLLVRTTHNCVVSSVKNIVVTGPDAEFSFSPAFICSGDSVTFHLDQISNTDEYKWFFGDGGSTDAANPTHQYFAKGYLTPSIWLRKGECEVIIDGSSLHVSMINAGFSLSDADGKYCVHDPLNAINESVYYTESLWQLDELAISDSQNLVNYLLNSSGSQNLKLTVTDALGCMETTEQSIIVNAVPKFNITGDTSICRGSTSSLAVTGINQSWEVRWTPSDIVTNASSHNTEVSPDTTTLFFATVTDSRGCSSVNSILVDVHDSYSLTRIPLGDTSIFIGESIELFIDASKENVTYSWEPNKNISCLDCANPIVSPAATTTYKVTTKDECAEITAAFLINVIVDHYLEFPQAFSPNGDNENDIFKYEQQNILGVEFKIFNRWGNLLFSTDRLDEGWDGQIKGKLQNIDTYTYYIKAKTVHGYEFEKKGTFLLVK